MEMHAIEMKRKNRYEMGGGGGGGGGETKGKGVVSIVREIKVT